MAKAEHDSITRRSLLSAAVALPVAAIPTPLAAVPSPIAPPDPIFAAIEAHARAYADLGAFADELADAEQTAWHAPRGQRRAANKRLKEAYAAEARFGDILGDATKRFVATIPQTLPGAAAALAYVRQLYSEGYPMCEEEECMMLLASTEHAICRAAGLPVPALQA
jgi:hypothetical protein